MDREARIGLNESFFREVNERLEQLADRATMHAEQLDLVCECGDAACVERISMGREEYEAMRADSTLFAVAPGHAKTEVEQIVEEHDGYDLVRKDAGEAEKVARETDPRD